MSNVWIEVADALRETVVRVSKDTMPPPRRFRVRNANPFAATSLDGGVTIDERDDDVELTASVRADVADGDIVLAQGDEDGDWVVTSVIKEG